MNLSKLKSTQGALLRLVPPATEVRIDGEAAERDEPWTLAEVQSACLRLVNFRTNQQAVLSPDHVHSFTSSPPGAAFAGFLELKVRIDISSREPIVTIIPSGPAKTLERPARQALHVRVRRLLDRVSPEILRAARSSPGTIEVMIGAANLALLNRLQEEQGFDELVAVWPNGNVCMGLGNRMGGHIHDEDALGSLHGIVLEIRAGLILRPDD